MKLFIAILFCTNILLAQGSKEQIAILEGKKIELRDQISKIHDSIKKIDSVIVGIKSMEFKKTITTSSFVATAIKGARIKEDSKVYGNVFMTLKEDKEVTILDYKNENFGVCVESVCGYVHQLFIKKNDEILEFMKIKDTQQKQFERLAMERELAEDNKERQEQEKRHIIKYGQKTYDKLKKGLVWLGISEEMAIISRGRPEKINSSLGSWGNHEQWVYRNSNLYFEDGILTSIQN